MQRRSGKSSKKYNLCLPLVIVSHLAFLFKIDWIFMCYADGQYVNCPSWKHLSSKNGNFTDVDDEDTTFQYLSF